jgi:hypothetical protein
MTPTQDPPSVCLRNSQLAFVQAIESWTSIARTAWRADVTTSQTRLDSNAVIDQVFDFAEQMLEVQRRYVKSEAAHDARLSSPRRALA